MTSPAPESFLGLSSVEARARLKFYGPNVSVSRLPHSPLAEFFMKMKNPLILLLLAASVVAFFLGDWVSAAMILFMVLLSTVLDFVNTYKSEQAVLKLIERVRVTATVLRDGIERDVPLTEVVPGDAAFLSAGDMVPADGVLVSAKDFFVNESSLTGESFPVEKRKDGDVWMGSTVLTGSALMVVQKTGASTKFGSIARDLAGRDEVTDFDRGMREFSILILRIIFFLVIGIVIFHFIGGRRPFDTIFFALALAVGLTPELLPMVVTLNLARGSVAMSRHGVIVKRLAAIQDFGAMDVLCTDKTGTITEDRITLVRYADINGDESAQVLEHAYVSSAYHTGVSNPLDNAVRAYASFDISGIEKRDEIPFDYERRRDSVVTNQHGVPHLITKGAPEAIFEICTKTLPHGEAFRGEVEARARRTFEKLCEEGFRVLAIAIKKLHEQKEVYGKEVEEDMSFLGFVAFYDPPKRDAEEALRKFREYGIEVKVVTGDHRIVTERMSREIGLAVKGVLEGGEIDRMNDRELALVVDATTLFVRVSPTAKERIIKALRARGHVVGYLGDGVNDAPSLKAADVGISVDTAVDVAKETADFIMLRKNLEELIAGVIEGRKTFANTSKYLMMTLSSNFGNMVSMAIVSFLLPFFPMLPIQILLNNLLYDASQSAIPFDQVDRVELARPRKWRFDFIKRYMMIFGPLSSIFDFLTFSVLLLMFGIFESSAPFFQTGWFLESIATQVLVVHIIRTRGAPFAKSWASKPLFVSTLAAVGIGWLVATTPQLGKILQFVPLPKSALLSIAVIVVAYLVAAEFAKRFFFRRIAAQ